MNNNQIQSVEGFTNATGSSTTNQKHNRSKLRRFRFSIRTLLILTTVLACILGWIGKEWRQSRYERQVGDEILKNESAYVRFLGIFDSWEQHYESWSQSGRPANQAWWRDLARWTLGERIFTIHLGDERVNLQPLSDLTNLRQLTLVNTPVKDLAPLTNLTSLSRLILTDTSVSDLTSLASLTKLKELNLQGSQVDSLTPLAGLTNLEELYIDATSDGDLIPLANLQNLKWLRIESTSETDLTPLAGIKDLEYLHLTTPSIGDLAPLSGLDTLEYLNIRMAFVSDLTTIGGLANLKRLIIVPAAGCDLTPISRLKKLNQLWLKGPCISKKQVQSLHAEISIDYVKYGGN